MEKQMSTYILVDLFYLFLFKAAISCIYSTIINEFTNDNTEVGPTAMTAVMQSE
jgi:hypothetical protein